MDDLEAYNLIVNGVQPPQVKSKNNDKSKAKKRKIPTKQEQIKILRNKHKIKCHSKTSVIPDPINSFSDLISRYDFDPDYLKCFESLNYANPTAVQMQSIPAMLGGHNVLTLAPTGSGKTAAFLLPILHEKIDENIEKVDKNIEKIDNNIGFPRGVVLSPTIELAKQTYQECICLVKELKEEQKPKIFFCCKENKKNNYWKKILSEADIIICTPSRFRGLITEKEGSKLVDLINLRWLIIDESDKMLAETVDSFADQFKDIYTACRISSPNFHVAMFSATQSAAVWHWANENLASDLIYVKVGIVGAAVDTVTQELRYCQNEKSKLADIKSLLTAGQLKCPCLVFLDKSDSTMLLYKLLEEENRGGLLKLAMISGEVSDGRRRGVIQEFREGRVHFLLCTNLMARGMDFKGVESVVNYDLPKEKEEYIHRIGRCGRAGRRGAAVTLWTDADIANGLVDVMRIMKASKQPVNEELFELVKQKRKAASKNYKGNRLLKKLKRKYEKTEGGEGEQGQRVMATTDKRRKMYFEKCVIRPRALEKAFKQMKEIKESLSSV